MPVSGSRVGWGTISRTSFDSAHAICTFTRAEARMLRCRCSSPEIGLNVMCKSKLKSQPKPACCFCRSDLWQCETDLFSWNTPEVEAATLPVSFYARSIRAEVPRRGGRVLHTEPWRHQICKRNSPLVDMRTTTADPCVGVC